MKKSKFNLFVSSFRNLKFVGFVNGKKMSKELFDFYWIKTCQVLHRLNCYKNSLRSWKYDDISLHHVSMDINRIFKVMKHHTSSLEERNKFYIREKSSLFTRKVIS